MTAESPRLAPSQGDGPYWLPEDHPTRKLREEGGGVHRPGSLSWDEYLEAHRGYVKRRGTLSSSPELVASRGGFSYLELVVYLGRKPATWVVSDPRPIW